VNKNGRGNSLAAKNFGKIFFSDVVINIYQSYLVLQTIGGMGAYMGERVAYLFNK
jgi:hypothetical protein